MNISGSSYRPIAVDFLTRSYRIVGKVLITHTGLLGILNDTNSSVVDIQDAHLARLHVPNKLADRFQVARLVKTRIVAVCVNRREDLGQAGYLSYTHTTAYPIHITTADFDIDGSLEWIGRFDPSALMGKGTGEYVPLYRASISSILIPSLQIETPAMLLNRKTVDLMALASEHTASEI
jgi:hypothetical protein